LVVQEFSTLAEIEEYRKEEPNDDVSPPKANGEPVHRRMKWMLQRGSPRARPRGAKVQEIGEWT